MAIVGAALGSWLLFDFVPNFLFLVGMVLVMASIVLYTVFPAGKKSGVAAVSAASAPTEIRRFRQRRRHSSAGLLNA